MRVVSWNCQSGGARKWPLLAALGADVAVVCEAPEACPSVGDGGSQPALGWEWAGPHPHKGLALASTTSGLGRLEPRPGQGRWSVAAETDGGPAILGIWSCPQRPGRRRYVDEVVATLTTWSDRITAGDMIVAGDLNVGPALGRPTDLSALEVARACWESLGLVSAYHAVTAEHLATPSRATYFHRRRPDEGWQIDYVLVPRARREAIRHVTVGSFDAWVAAGYSDHVPVVVDLDW